MNDPEMTTEDVLRLLNVIRVTGGQKIIEVRTKTGLTMSGDFVRFENNVLSLDVCGDEYADARLEDILFIRYRNATELSKLPPVTA